MFDYKLLSALAAVVANRPGSSVPPKCWVVAIGDFSTHQIA